MMALNVPATFGLIALATPIVELLFERGRFVRADTAATAAAVRFYAIGLAGYSAVRIASPTFYALGDSRTPVVVSGVAIATNLLVSIALVRAIGFAGLALGASAAAMTNAAVLLWILRARLGGLDDRRLVATITKVTIAAAIMTVVAVAIQHAMDRVAPGAALFARSLRLSASIGGALAALAGAARALGVEELEELRATAVARVQKLLRR
jgi:putative peptidoglycan lipid II flippase